MPYSYDEPTNEARLLGGADKWTSGVYEWGGAVPSGCTHALYMMRFWLTSLPATPHAEGNFLHGYPAMYFGLSHNGTLPKLNDHLDGEWDGFSGVMADFYTSGDSNYCILTQCDVTDTVRDNFVRIGGDAAGTIGDVGHRYIVGVGNSLKNLDSNVGAVVPPAAIPHCIPLSKAFGETATLLIRAAKDAVTNEVNAHIWWNLDSVDLDALDVLDYAALDPNDPYDVFPVSRDEGGNKLEDTVQLNANTFGTDWVPTDGVFAPASHAVFAHPFQNVDWVIRKLKVQYGVPVA